MRPLRSRPGLRATVSPSAGVDLVEVAQVRASLETFGDRYLRRLFTDGEIAYCLGAGRDAPTHLAARFAAKEATLKALCVGDQGIDRRSIEVHRDAEGACGLRLHGAARILALHRGIRDLALSMTHDGGYAAAFVVGNRACGRTPRAARGAQER